MEAKELRIGNLIYFDDKIITVKGVINNTIYFNEGFAVNICGFFKPVTITEDMLLKLKFTFTPCGISGADMWQGLGFWIFQHQFGTIVFRGDKNCKHGLKLNGYINTDYKYLHQIQNICFDLGEELDISPLIN